jgi:hypothetical protein
LKDTLLNFETLIVERGLTKEQCVWRSALYTVCKKQKGLALWQVALRDELQLKGWVF